MKKMKKSGIGIQKKQARPIELEDEELFWSSKIFDVTNPQGLSNAVFYYFGLRCAMRGGQEMYEVSSHNVRITYIAGKKNLVYNEGTSKSTTGGVKDRKADPKIVKIPENSSLRNKGLVKLVELYNSKRGTNLPYFWCKPLPVATGEYWFARQRVGINTRKAFLRRITDACGMQEATNHSMRRTSITRLYQAGQ